MKSLALPERRPARPVIAVDYPQEGEVIDSPSYTFRIAGIGTRVEVAIDGGGWNSCRRSDDFWWFDWSGYDCGRHQVIARSAPQPGHEPVTRTCRFVVAFPEGGRR